MSRQDIIHRDPDATEIEVASPGRQVVLTPMDMLSRAVEQGANVEIMEKLLGLQERWERNQARKAFEAAITSAKAELPSITKNKTVAFGSRGGGQGTSYKHETLDHVVETIRPVLEAHGLSFRFRTDVRDDGRVVVTCRIAHRDGHSEETSLPAPPDTSGSKNSIQAIGSAVTYLSRYTLKAALGLAATDDDDGQAVGSGDTVSDEQVRRIMDLINETNTDTVAFCRYLKIASIPAMPAKLYSDAIKSLQAKAARNKGARS